MWRANIIFKQAFKLVYLNLRYAKGLSRSAQRKKPPHGMAWAILLNPMPWLCKTITRATVLAEKRLLQLVKLVTFVKLRQLALSDREHWRT
jgi:hypothetical protein